MPYNIEDVTPTPTPVVNYPVNFVQQPTADIGSTPTLIFGATYTSVLDGLILVNNNDNAIIASIYLLRENSDQIVQQIYLANKIVLQSNQMLDILENKTLFLNNGDTLFASSDYASSTFNTFISLREFTNETPIGMGG